MATSHVIWGPTTSKMLSVHTVRIYTVHRLYRMSRVIALQENLSHAARVSLNERLQ